MKNMATFKTFSSPHTHTHMNNNDKNAKIMLFPIDREKIVHRVSNYGW